MKLCYILLLAILLSTIAFSQEIKLFGPRAGIGNLTNSGNSSIEKGILSAFGWQIEFPYTSGDLTGYGEGGFMLLGIEQQRIYPHFWGYFGCRYKELGGGIGPVFNSIGIGLGINVYKDIILENLRIPIGLDFNFIGKSTRAMLFIGFHYK
jgi:hypothetical protein